MAVIAVNKALELLGDHLVALAQQHIEHGLRAHDLAGGGNQRRIAGILAHCGNFLQHIFQLVFLAGFLQLTQQVAEHAAGNLIQQRVGINAQHFGAEQAALQILFTQLCEVLTHNIQLLQIQTGIVLGALQGSHQAFGGHMRGAQCQGADSGINDICTGFDALEDRHRGQTRGVVAVNVHRNGNAFLQLFHQLVRSGGCEQTGHILDADGVCAHLFQRFGVVCKILVVMHRAQGVADAGLHMSLFLNGCLNGGFQVAGIVQCVKNTHDVDAVCNRLLHKVFHHIVSIVAIAQHILAAEQHLQLSVGHFFAQDAQALPGIFVQETNAAVKGRAAPALYRVVTYFVHSGQNGAHFVHGHAGSDQRLVRIAQSNFCDLDGFCIFVSQSNHLINFLIIGLYSVSKICIYSYIILLHLPIRKTVFSKR